MSMTEISTFIFEIRKIWKWQVSYGFVVKVLGFWGSRKEAEVSCKVMEYSYLMLILREIYRPKTYKK